eukprot:gene10088-biopygen8940
MNNDVVDIPFGLGPNHPTPGLRKTRGLRERAARLSAPAAHHEAKRTQPRREAGTGFGTHYPQSWDRIVRPEPTDCSPLASQIHLYADVLWTFC